MYSPLKVCRDDCYSSLGKRNSIQVYCGGCGFGTGVVLSFALAALVCVPNALSYAELSNRFPALVGGAYLYSYSTFNELTAFLVFCHLMLDYHIGAASITRSLASYFITLLQVKFYLFFSSDDLHLLQLKREP